MDELKSLKSCLHETGLTFWVQYPAVCNQTVVLAKPGEHWNLSTKESAMASEIAGAEGFALKAQQSLFTWPLRKTKVANEA